MEDKKTIRQLLTSPVETYFDDLTIRKSGKYLLGVRITEFHEVDNKIVMASVHGTKKYTSSIVVNNNELTFRCNCPREGLCKHEAALYQYAQSKLNIKIYEEDRIIKMTSDEIYLDLKKQSSGRTSFNKNNINDFSNGVLEFLNELENLKNKNKFYEYFSLYTHLLDALARFEGSNINNDLYVFEMEKIINSTFETVSNNVMIFKMYYRNITDLSNSILMDYFFNAIKELKLYRNEELMDLMKEKINYVPSYLVQKLKEKYSDKINFLKIKGEFENNNYKNIDKVKLNLRYNEFRDLYINYLKDNNRISEIKILYNKYINYDNYSDELFKTFISVFKDSEEKLLYEDAILNYIKYGKNNNEVEEFIINSIGSFSDDYIRKIGFELYRNSRIFIISKLVKNYPIFKIYEIANVNFPKIDSDFLRYKEEYLDELKKIYYLEIIHIFKSDILLSTISKKKIMRYIERLHTLSNGDYYIFEIYEFYKVKRYVGVFPELERYVSNIKI